MKIDFDLKSGRIFDDPIQVRYKLIKLLELLGVNVGEKLTTHVYFVPQSGVYAISTDINTVKERKTMMALNTGDVVALSGNCTVIKAP